MEVHEHEGIRYYLDDIAVALTENYDSNKINGPHCLTGNIVDEVSLYPFLFVAYNTGKYWGFDFEGYRKVVDLFSEVKGVANYMGFAKEIIKSESDLERLAQAGHIRRVMHETTSVYFVSELLAVSATNIVSRLLPEK